MSPDADKTAGKRIPPSPLGFSCLSQILHLYGTPDDCDICLGYDDTIDRDDLESEIDSLSDFNNDDAVNMKDFDQLAPYWLEECPVSP